MPAQFFQNKRMTKALRPLLTARVSLVVAPPGYGKTQAVRRFLGKRKAVAAHWLEPPLPGEGAPLPQKGASELTAVVLDCAGRAIQDDLLPLLDWAAGSEERRLVLIARSIPDAAAPLLYRGSCALVEKHDLAFSPSEATDYLSRWGVVLTEREEGLLGGWPALVRICAGARGMTETAQAQMREYVRGVALPSLPSPVRAALSRFAPQDRFSLQEAARLGGPSKAERLLIGYAADGLLEFDGRDFWMPPLLAAALAETCPNRTRPVRLAV